MNREIRNQRLLNCRGVRKMCRRHIFSHRPQWLCREDTSGSNPNKRDRNKFTKEQIARLWELAEDPYYQIVLMLIYNGCRISEFLDLKKENIHLEEQYFDVIASKTENGLRKVPIADKVLPFYKAWYEGSQCEYLLHTPDQKHFD